MRPRTTQATTAATLSDAHMPGPLIYLFEDDASLQRLLDEVLREELGATVVVCSGLTSIREQSLARVPDLIVADFWGTSQLHLADDERAQISALGQVAPLVLVSARRWAENITPDELGVAALVGKPLELDEFVEVLRQALAAGRRGLTPGDLTPGEVADEQAEQLPPREALSVYFLPAP
jgi:DNA-binding response OmpR family regulator